MATSREPVPRLVTNVGKSPDGHVEVQVKDGSWIEIDRITGYTTA
nr:hypothetical protein [Actinoplanes polyasparticus]